MSEGLGLGESDADVRWIGLRRHQAVLAVLGVALAGSGALAWGASPSPWELGCGLALVAATVVVDGTTVALAAVTWLSYLARGHWCDVAVVELGGDVLVAAGREVTVRTYALEHVGRRDLAGRDVEDAHALARLLDATSSSPGARHVSLHVRRDGASAVTALALAPSTTPLEGWRPDNALAAQLAGLADGVSSSFLERFTYLRGEGDLRRVYRVRDFSAVTSDALLEGVTRGVEAVDVAVHFDVVEAARAHRLAARAVHRVTSDDVTSRAFGFRRSARAARSLERLARRESLVAEGRALVRVAVFIEVRAPSLAALRRRGASVWRQCHDAGLRLERGGGRQAAWYRAHLPGAPGW